MSIFSKACEYAIKSCIYIAQRSVAGQITTVKQISEAIDAPLPFTAKILQQISKGGFLVSTRGKQGGFSIIEESLHEIKIIDIVTIIDGPAIFKNCGLGLKLCSSENPCPIHHDYSTVRDGLRLLVEKYSLYDLAVKADHGEIRLKV